MGMDVNNSRLSGMDQMAQASQSKRTDGAGNQPPAAEVDEFEQLMKGEPTGAKGNKEALKDGKPSMEAHSQMRDAAQGKDSLSQASDSKMPSADNLFASMFGMQNQQAPNQATGQAAASVEAAGPISDPDAMDTLVNKMVDRILVSDPAKGQQEVRLTFNDAALKGTDVTLSRATDGQLMVKLDTTDKASYQTLVGAQDSLRAALERTGQNVRVEASLSSEQQDNNSNQRSKGYQEYKDDDENKRS